MHPAEIYNQVWRTSLSQPGFCDLPLTEALDSHALRQRMVDLKRALSKVLSDRTGQQFTCCSLHRFDQQVTTRFHLDGGPDFSLLILGYEPTRVQSRVFLADYTRAAHDRGLPPAEYLERFNPLFPRGEAALAGYITGLPPQAPGTSRILLVNNSLTPLGPGEDSPLGVLHKAEILGADESESRVINSMLLTPSPAADPTECDQERLFVSTTELSRKYAS